MRLLLRHKAGLVALAILAITLSAGVAWASGVRAPWSQVEIQTPEIVVTPMVVGEGKPAITIYGAGFVYDGSRARSPGELVFVSIVRADGGDIFMGQATTNDNRAFELVVQELSADISPGVYTVKAASSRTGVIVTHPLVVVVPK